MQKVLKNNPKATFAPPRAGTTGNGCMNVAWGWFWGGVRSPKHCFSVRSAVFSLPQCSGGLKLLWMRLGVRSSGVVWNLWLQTDVDWLRDCCHLLLPCA